MNEKGLRKEELRGLREDKLKSIRSFAKFLADDAAWTGILSAIAWLRQLTPELQAKS